MKKMKGAKKHPKAELRKLRLQAKELKNELKKASKTAENGIQSSLRQFTAAVKNAEKQLKKLEGTGKEAWVELKKDVRITWRDLKHFAKKATSQIKF